MARGSTYPDSAVVLSEQSPTFSMGPSVTTTTLVTPSLEDDPVLGDCTRFIRSGYPHAIERKNMQEEKCNKKQNKNKRKNLPAYKSSTLINPDAAGIDVHPTNIFIAVPPDRDTPFVRKFETFTQNLLEAVAWLKECKIRTIAMESTGVYWIPLYQLLEDHGFEVCLVNARHVKNVPGRKTDVGDAQWIQYLHSVGLLRGSFRPAQEICALRSIARHRESLLQMGSVHIQHMQKALDQMNLHLHHVISDITGVTGLAIMEAILTGERDRKKLAEHRDPRIKCSEEIIIKSLEGDYRREHLFVLQQSLNSWKYVHKQIDECDSELECLTRQRPLPPDNPPIILAHNRRKKISKNQPKGYWQELLANQFGVDLTAVPGIQTATVQTLFTELGSDWSCFPTASHFSSWLNLCPTNELSNGKVVHHRKLRTHKRLRVAFRLAAFSLHHNQSPLGDEFRRFKSKLGPTGAITTMAHKLARIIWHLVTFKTPYDESIFFQAAQIHKASLQRKLIKRIESMGYIVTPNAGPVPLAP
jgi:transposase